MDRGLRLDRGQKSTVNHTVLCIVILPYDLHNVPIPLSHRSSIKWKFPSLNGVWLHRDRFHSARAVLQENGSDLSDILVAIKEENSTEDKAKELFITSKEEIHTADPFRQAVLFWILNKLMSSG